LSSHTYSILIGTTVAFLLVFSLFSSLALSTTPMTGIYDYLISHLHTPGKSFCSVYVKIRKE